MRTVPFLVAFLFLAAASSRAEDAGLERLARPPITVLHAPENRGFAAAVAERAARHHQRVREDLGLTAQVEVAILLLTESMPPELRQRWRQQLPRWLAGAAFTEDQFIVVRVRPGETPRDLDPLLTHELTHVILKIDFPSSADWPLWFREGLAMREGGGDDLPHFMSLSLAILRNRLLPLATLRHDFPENEAGSRLAYAESRSFSSFLAERAGREGFARFLQRLRREPFESALAAHYGAGAGVLEQEWRRRLNRPYAWIPLVTSATAFWSFILILFFVALALRMRKSRRLREQWDEEERDVPPAS